MLIVYVMVGCVWCCWVDAVPCWLSGICIFVWLGLIVVVWRVFDLLICSVAGLGYLFGLLFVWWFCCMH